MSRKTRNYCCMDCGNKISRASAIYGEGRCKSCAGKLRIGQKSNNFKTGNWRKSIDYFCLDCNKKISRGNSKRCTECYHKYTKDNELLVGKKNPMYGKKGKKHHLFGKPRLDMIGKNNPSYIHGEGKRKYPSKFLTLRSSILERDNYICQNCLITHTEHIIQYGKSIEVHHIDYNKQNCEELNLITLCRKCNMKANRNRDYWQKYYTSLVNPVVEVDSPILKNENLAWLSGK